MQMPGLARIAVLLFALLAAAPAMAYHGHGHGRAHIEFFVGIPADSWRSPRPYYYRHQPPPAVRVPPLATVAPPPSVYIERSEESASTATTQPEFWWYYCPGRGAYYPYVKTCPQGWQQVAPQPADLR
jgi:hypothetical protein